MLNKLAIKSSKAAVVSLECQLAQVQIKRFLNGDNIPEDLLKDLEQHLLSCSDCLAVAKGERDAIEAHMVATPAEAAQIRQKAPASNVLDVFKQPKTLALSVGLGVVLILMSTIMRDPTKLLGAKAINAHPETAKVETETKGEEESKPTGEKATEKTAEHGDEKAPDKATDPKTGQEAKPTDEHAATAPATDVKQPETKPTDTPHTTTAPAGQSTPPGPASAALKAAQEAAKKSTPKPDATGKPTLGAHPIVEVTEGNAKPPVTKTTKPTPKPTTKATAPRRAPHRRPAPKPAVKHAPKSNGGIKIYH